MPDKILAVDDEPDILNMVKLFLVMGKFQVVTASDGEEALRKAQIEMPDLILMDVVMPGKSGLDTCRILKSNAKTRHIPIVISTVLDRDVDRRSAREAGCDSFLAKTFTKETLLAEVRKQLDQVRSEKFSGQLGLEHGQLRGKRLLLEFDPSAPYERLVRDFALECRAHDEAVMILTKKESTLRETIGDTEGIELADVTSDLMLAPLLEKYQGRNLSLVFDSLTDIALSVNAEAAYKFVRNAIESLSVPSARTGTTALFLLNPAAHDQKDVNSLRELFSNQVTYGKQGIASVKIA